MRISLQMKAELGPMEPMPTCWPSMAWKKEAVLIDAPPDCEKWVFHFWKRDPYP